MEVFRKETAVEVGLPRPLFELDETAQIVVEGTRRVAAKALADPFREFLKVGFRAGHFTRVKWQFLFCRSAGDFGDDIALRL